MNDMQHINLADLPQSARNLVRLIGLPKTMRLIDQLGGTTFPVAKGQTHMGQERYRILEEIIGAESADIITQEYGGELLYIPNCKEALRRARDRAIHDRFDRLIKRDYSANKAVAEISRTYKLSDRRVWAILKKLPDTAPQPSLF